METLDPRLAPYWRDIEPIIKSGQKRTRFDVRIQLHTEKEDINVISVSSLDISADYVKNIGQEIIAVINLGLGDYAKRLYPYRQMVEASVKMVYKYDSPAREDEEAEVEVTRYRAYFDDSVNLVIEAGQYDDIDIQTLNLQTIVPVKFQLMDRALEVLRVMRVDGTWRNVKPEDLIKSVMQYESLRLEIDGRPSIDGFDIVPLRNTEMIRNLLLPGVYLSDIPSYLQERVCGIYQHAVGTFLQTYREKRMWFVYPLYDHDRYESQRPKAEFYAIDPRALPGVDRTFIVRGDVLSVVLTENRRYNDSADNDNLNQGQGFRQANIKAITRKPAKMTAEGPVAERVKLNHEVSHLGRDDQVEFAPVAAKGASNNPYYAASKVMMRASGRIDFTWENGDPRHLYPGMPCRYHYVADGELVSVDGTVLFWHQLMTPQGRAITAENFTTKLAVTIGVTPRRTKPEPIAQRTFGRFER